MQGIVTRFNDERGFGFIRVGDGRRDIFVHFTGIRMPGVRKTLREGQRVEFDLAEGERGPKAVDVVALDDGTAGVGV